MAKEKVKEQKPVKTKKKKNPQKSRLAFPLGLLAVVLAIIGAVTVVNFAVDKVQLLTDRTAEKAEYEKFLKPVVMFDPDPFDDLGQADITQLLNSAVWALLTDETNSDKYEYLEGGLKVPQADIEAKFISLFGTEIDIASMHTLLDMSVYDISYDSTLQCYIIPVTGVETAYTPKVFEIKEQGSTVILTVGYIGNEVWAQIDSPDSYVPEPDKYMEITLRERDDNYYIAAIKAIDSQEVATVATTRQDEVGNPDGETQTDNLIAVQTVTAAQAPEYVTDENGETVTNEDGEPETVEPETSAEGEEESTGETEDETSDTDDTTEEYTEE